MKLDLDRQPSGRSHLDVSERFRTEAPEPLPAEIELTGRLTVDNLEGRVVVLGTLAGTAAAVCDRCLDEFVCRFEAAVEVVVIRAADQGGEADPSVIHQRRGEVDLAEPLREAGLVGLPQKMLCAEDCRGLCPGCGANRNREACDCPPAESEPGWELPPG